MVNRQIVAEVMTTHHLSQRRACGLIGITRRNFPSGTGGRSQSSATPATARSWPRNGAAGAVRCFIGYFAARAGRPITSASNGFYRQVGLSLHRRRRRKRLSHLRVVRARPLTANQTWAVDFIHDSLVNARRFRTFAVLDERSRES